ncbi:MAG: hypothetical protein A2020_08335 [Lentisphaerae bacterium GWF2_45_14]|nr:MAG: hypothetical protein A2020_08335 [Lentisphaerae bacterium GWF2_45_14]
MNTVKYKTIEEHLQFLYDFVLLMLFYASAHKAQNVGKDIKKIISENTMLLEICRTDASEKVNILDILAEVNEKGGNRPEIFETTAFPMLKKQLDQIVQTDYEENLEKPRLKGFNAGSLKYDPPIPSLPANHCNFHICNAIAPKSIFEDETYLPECFLSLMDKSEKEYAYDTLRTFTWLNAHPAWLRLFPDEWQNNLGTHHPGGLNNLGIWGQVINAKGLFNEKAGSFIRKNLEFQYKPRASHCSFENMRIHLEKLLKGNKNVLIS